MKRLALAAVVGIVAVAWIPGAGPQTVKTHQVTLNGHTFTLPADFDIELAAGPPLVDRPIVADFDEEGRLYVADSSGSNEPVAVQVVKKPHRILRLEDTNGDGKFDKRTVFADKMMFPEGCMWFAGSLYVSAPPSIWKLTDTDGDGVADQRIEWFKGKTLTGCANDLHGPYLGLDGWIYWCKGAFAKQTYERPGKPPFVTRASHIFRCRPDGSGIEPVMTGGMDNPVDVAFTPGGERIFTTTFFQHPGGGRRDGLIHAVYGGIYGKDHNVIYDPAHKWTSPALMPVLTHLGAAAPCGLTRYESRVFGPEYQDNLFACSFNMHKITRHVLTPVGASFSTRDEDFLVSSNLDFHPTDIHEDADGSLLVVDTGGWYKLCCPTSQLHKPDIMGAIYRIKRKGVPRIDDPRGRKLAWVRMTVAELAKLLGDVRPAVRRRAVQVLANKDAKAVPALVAVIRSSQSAEARRNAVWAATRIDRADARAAVRQALTDADETTRQAAIHSISVRRDREAAPALVKLLKSPSLSNRRAAAEALGRLGDKSAVPALLAAAGNLADRALEHSLTYALIEIGDATGTAVGLKRGEKNLTRRAALVALDQMDGGGLKPEIVAAELASEEARTRETAWWIAGRHSEWAVAVTGFLRDRLTAADRLMPAAQDELVRHLTRFAHSGPVQQLLAERLADPSASRNAHLIALRAMARANLKEVPETWLTGLMNALSGNNSDLLAEAIATARAVRIAPKHAAKLSAILLTIGKNEKAPEKMRLSALAAVPGGLAKLEPALFAFLRSHLDSEQPVIVRTSAAEVLAKAKLDAGQLVTLTESLKTAGPLEVNRLLDAFAQSTDEKVGQTLVAVLKASPARSSLRVETLKPRLAKYSPAVQRQAEELYAVLNVDAAKQRTRLEQLLSSLKDGDVRRGQVVFNGTKAACASCHAIGYLGGNVGPDLTHIGKIRNERDLLESIVFPSASFVRSYEPVQVTTKSGKVHNGLIRKDAPDEVLLATGVNQEVRIARDDIEEVQPSKVSVMPAGLDQQLTVRELADLVAFLKACK
ncbi:MAG TPA: PVC-type heme-binding CxxCH protein [Gemmataceae bacterium]|nr:PVC-type heme-binding CxxCH protein [Gemmataceae bacterium]